MNARKTVLFRALAVAASLAAGAILFLSVEFGVRVIEHGPAAAVSAMNPWAAPYSDLGTGNWIIFDPHLGYKLNPARPDVNDRFVRHRTFEIPKPEGRTRALVLGDSLPWDQPSFVDFVFEKLPPARDAEVINASVPGYTTHQQAEFFRRHLRETRPDLVVWVYCLNDNHRFLHKFDSRLRMLWTDEARESLEALPRWKKIARRSLILRNLRWVRRPEASRDARYPWERDAGFNTAWKEETWPAYREHLRSVRELVKESGGALTVVAVPLEAQLPYKDETARHDYILRPQRRLAAACAAEGVPFLDLYPAFAAETTGLFRDGIHLTRRGHEVAAREIAAHLRREKLWP